MELIKGYLRSREYEALLEKEAMSPEFEELEQHQEDLRIARGQKPKKMEFAPKLDLDAIADMEAVTWSLKAISQPSAKLSKSRSACRSKSGH